MIDFTPTGPSEPGPRRPLDGDHAAFLEALSAASGRFADRRIGAALQELQSAAPMDSQGYGLQQAAQSIGGNALRLAMSPEVTPRQAGLLSGQVATLAEAGHNLPRIEQVAREIRANLAAIGAGAPLERGADLALRKADDRTEYLQSLSSVAFPYAPAMEANASTARTVGLVAQMNALPWRGAGPRDEVSAALQGIVGLLHSMAATAGGPGAPERVRDMLDAVITEVSRAVSGETSSAEMAPRILGSIDALTNVTIARTGALLGMEDNIQGMSADTMRLFEAVVARRSRLMDL